METPSGKTILSGIQPSGTLHIGNYLGALKQWVALQENNTAYYCIVDEHAITVEYDPKELPDRTLNAAAIYLAAGVDPKKSTLFVQSHIPAHTELAWLLSTITQYGELTRMTQFKDKSAKKESVSFGIFAYPVLMAADILLYHAHLVPVGDDQKQHVELTRDLAQRFNNRFGETFTLPGYFASSYAARVMSLADPTRKMSKSDGEKTYVAITDEPDAIRKKVMSATTETEPIFSFERSGPAVKNLLRIYQAFSDESPAGIEKKFSGKGYKELKEALAELLVEKLTPIREQYTELRQDEKHLRDTLEAGRAKAAIVANKTLRDAKEKMGLPAGRQV
ncbi:MAG: tryptophan--tRNA ligase [Patescibacteria group bacterium]